MSNTIVDITQTCSACPTQYEGILDDHRVIYIRYRHGRFTIGVGNDLKSAIMNTIFELMNEDPLDGSLNRTQTYFMISRAGFKFTQQARDRLLNGPEG